MFHTFGLPTLISTNVSHLRPADPDFDEIFTLSADQVPLSFSLLLFLPRSQSQWSRSSFASRPPGSLGGRTVESNAGWAWVAWRSVGESVAYDSRTFPAVLTNDPTYYWATATAAAAAASPSFPLGPHPTRMRCHRGKIITHRAPGPSLSHPAGLLR